MIVRRLAWAAGVLFVAYYAVEGGEYGASDLLAQREDVAEIEAELALLRDTVSVLDSTLKLVSTDDFTLERVAREQHGLVRGPKELLYWVESPVTRDSTNGDSVKKSVVEDSSGVDSDG
ncbi:FtsB family cell division protein [Gemmatimonas sp.]